MDIVLRGEDAKDWAYKGEGAANLILCYIGSSPLLLGKVLRIRKVQNESTGVARDVALSVHEQLIWSNVVSMAEDNSAEGLAQSFAKHVISQLLGAIHIDAGTRISVSKDFLTLVEKNVLSYRPAWRVDTGTINTDADSALLISDHTVFAGLQKGCVAVEIKPKCGFLPVSEYISNATSVKKCVSRYRMHQLMKFQKGEIMKISEYDPLDLFSKSSRKIQKAIRALFATPQNNLRVFVDGSLIYGGMGGDTESANADQQTDTMVMAKDPIMDNGLQLSDLIYLVAEALHKSNILDQLLSAQKLDNLDIEGAIHAYYNIICQPCLACNSTKDQELLPLYSSIHTLPLEESLQIVRDYLISATAKDCSLIICFRLGENGVASSGHGTIHLNSLEKSFNFKAYFVDLDMKPLEKMAYYYKLDQKIVNFYKSMVN